eukprot:6465551-Amphidinium_carterae.1
MKFKPTTAFREFAWSLKGQKALDTAWEQNMSEVSQFALDTKQKARAGAKFKTSAHEGPKELIRTPKPQPQRKPSCNSLRDTQAQKRLSPLLFKSHPPTGRRPLRVTYCPTDTSLSIVSRFVAQIGLKLTRVLTV